MHYVIIGAGPAGITAAETLRKQDPGAEITVLGDEPEPPYARMALPYYLSGQIDAAGTWLRKNAGHFESLSIDLLQEQVVKVVPERQVVQLHGGQQIRYDKLLIATGSRPVKPPIQGIDMPGIQHCWTLQDGRNIAEALRPGVKVVLMGAGFIGCIVLEALHKSGASLTVVEMAARMVPRMMNDTAAGMIRQWCLDKGVTIHLGARIEAFQENSGNAPGIAVQLNDSRSIEADLVVVAAGVRANIEFLDQSGIATDQGILVNRHLQSSDENIYAAGDVAQGLDFSTGEYTVQAIQPTAVDHGLLAARNMAGGNQAIHQGSVNMNVLDTMGLIACSFGLWMGADGGDFVERHDPGRYRYINLQFDGEHLVGATAIGLTEHVGVLRGLIQSRIALGPWKQRLLKDPGRIMEAYLECTQPLAMPCKSG